LKQQAKWWSRHEGIDISEPLLKKQADSGRSQQGHKTMGKLLNYQQQAKWRSRHKGANIAGKPIFWTASPSGLGQQGC
jgi:hypothetical protein